MLTTLIEKHRTYVRTNSLLMEVAVAPIRPEDHAFVFQASVLVDLRRKLDLNQAELAESLDVPVNTLSRWERGSNVPDANALAALFSIAKERGLKPEFFKQREGAIMNRQGNRILIFESILIYQHFHPEPLTFHPEPVEGLHPLPLILNLLPLNLSLSKDCCSPLPSS